MKEDRSSSMYLKKFSVGHAKIVVPTYILTEISAILDQNNGKQLSTVHIIGNWFMALLYNYFFLVSEGSAIKPRSTV